MTQGTKQSCWALGGAAGAPLDAGPGREQPAPERVAAGLAYCQVVKPIDSVFGEPPEIALTLNCEMRPSLVFAQT